MPRIPDFSPAELQTRARADLQRFAVTQAAYARATQAAMPPGGGDATSRFLGQFRDEAQAMAARWSPEVRQRLAWRIDELGSELTGPLAEAEAGERRRYHVERQDGLDTELLRTIAEHPDAAMRDAAEQQLTAAVPASPDLPQVAWDARRAALPDRLAAAKGAAILADPEARRAIWQRPPAPGEAGPGDAGSPRGPADAAPAPVPTAIDPATLADGGHGHAGAWFRARYPDASDAVTRKFASGAVQRHGEDRDRAAAERDAVMGLVAPDYLSILTTGRGHPDLTPNRILKSLAPGLAKLVFEGQRKAGERYVARLQAGPAGGVPSEVPLTDRRPVDLAAADPTGAVEGAITPPQAGAATPASPGRDGPAGSWQSTATLTLPGMPAGVSAAGIPGFPNLAGNGRPQVLPVSLIRAPTADPAPALPPDAVPAPEGPKATAGSQAAAAPAPQLDDPAAAEPPDSQPDGIRPWPTPESAKVAGKPVFDFYRTPKATLRDDIRRLVEASNGTPGALRPALDYAITAAFATEDTDLIQYLRDLARSRGLDTTEIDSAAAITARLLKRAGPGWQRSLTSQFVDGAANRDVPVAVQIVELEHAAERGDAARAVEFASAIARVRGESGPGEMIALDAGLEGTAAAAYLGPAVRVNQDGEQRSQAEEAARVYAEMQQSSSIGEGFNVLKNHNLLLEAIAGAGGGGGRFRGGGGGRAGGSRTPTIVEGTGEAAVPKAKPAKVPQSERTEPEPRGVDPLHHNANVLVRDPAGNVINRRRFVSGYMTPQEKALGYPNGSYASHTEARATREIELQPGETMTIVGQNPPCSRCKGAMNTAVTRTGATIIYQWRQDGKTRFWKATPRRRMRK
ncbi:hypothetical protein [Labrys wisconsinensis]|uniref:Deaminase n=1 Tax=Labrys wisconsinensis TaxID=425677 RepID=A0ABU0JEN0_9HYPH|nr:hypothetical protein [Labrys wisconsinensis]MDQ0472736.1 hypothetical protein [Labrys wisconsinensis]